MKQSISSPATLWFSGFFGLGFVVHLLRLVFQVPLTVGDQIVPMSTSVFVAIVFGGLSAGLLYMGCKKSCC